MSQVSHIYPKCPKCFICPKCLLYIPSVPNVPESQMAHMFQMSHVSQMAHMSEVSQVFQMSHVSQLSHVSQMSCVSQMSDVSKKNKALQIMMENTSGMANINHMGVQGHLLWLPLYAQRWGHFGFTSVLSVRSVCPIYFCQSVQRFLSCRRSNTRRWPDALTLMFAHCLRRWPNISPVLGYRVVLAPRWMWASVTDGEPTLTQLLFKASCPYCQHAGAGSMKYWLGLNGYWPAPTTLAQHLTGIGSVSACIRRQQY